MPPRPTTPPAPAPVLVTVPRPQVNGVCMEGKQHGDVVSAIKAGGEETELLVVDKETDEFFKKCKVTPSHEHLHGELEGWLEAPKPGMLAADSFLQRCSHPLLQPRPRGVGGEGVGPS